MQISGVAQALQNTWNRMTDPSYGLEGLEQRQNAKTLSAMLLLTIPLLVVYFVFKIRWLQVSEFYEEAADEASWMVLATLLLTVSYLASRTRYFNAAAMTAITSGSLISIYGAVSSRPIDFIVFYYMALPLFFSVLLLPRRMSYAYIMVNVVLMVIFIMVDPALRSTEFIRGPVTFLMFTVFIVFLTATYRGRLEQVRQAELTLLVEERTASLREANIALLSEVKRRNQAEAKLKDEVTFYSALFNKTNDAVFIMDLKGRHLRANRRATEMLGYTHDEIVGMHYSEFVASEELQNSDSVFDKLLNGDTMPVYERLFRRKDGSLFPVELNVALVRDSEGQPRYLQSAARDITERKNIEEKLEQALADEKQVTDMRSRFFSMVSHEFRTPLTVIMSSNGILTQYHNRLDEQRRLQHQKRIENEVGHLKTLLDEVMLINQGDAHRIEFTPEYLNLCEFCNEIIEELEPTLNTDQKLAFSAPEPCLEALVDRNLLRRILVNLLSNAIKYSPNGGTITLTLDMQGEGLKFRVIDQGIGIPVEDQPHMFEVFHRAGNVGKINGTGLGLVIVRQAVEAHGGQLSFESTPGEGTTFTVELPCEVVGTLI